MSVGGLGWHLARKAVTEVEMQQERERAGRICLTWWSCCCVRLYCDLWGGWPRYLTYSLGF